MVTFGECLSREEVDSVLARRLNTLNRLNGCRLPSTPEEVVHGS